MSINRIISAGIMLGFLLGGGSAMAQEPSMLTGGGRFGVTLESSFSSREVKIDDAKERLRVIRQAIRVSYGLADWIDIYIKGGPGRIEFQKLDLSSKTRPAFGGGIRLLGATKKGYFAGFSFQHQTGTVSKFSSGDQSFSLEDDWTEQDVLLFTGTKDLISGPQFNGRIYTGLRFSKRDDDLTFPDGTGAKSGEDSTLGAILGVEFSDSDIFRTHIEAGTGDQNSLFASLGLVF